MTAQRRPLDPPDRGHDGLEPDPDLLRRAAAGDRAAMDALARAWWPRMRRWAFLEAADGAAAEDACQEALVRLIRHLHRYDPARGRFGPWLRTVVRNAARDQRRGAVLPFVERGGAAPRLGQRLDLRRSAEAALAALRALTPRQRHLIDLCDWQGMDVAEAAEILGITPGTVRVHLHDARQRLRALLGPDVGALVRGEGR